MAYTTINKSTDYFNTKLYSGNSSTNNITGVGFQPDWLWIKARNYAENHVLYDAIRGVTKQLYSNTGGAESTNATALTAFASDGFNLATANGNTNANGTNFVAWNWKAGTGQGSSNTDGSTNTTYPSVNTTAGFSISTYTGTGSTATVGHGLGVVPSMIIIKRTDDSDDWQVYHKGIGNTKYLTLNSNATSTTSSTRWNDTTPTSTVFTVGTAGATNGSGRTFVAYCFAEKTGYSKFGSYTGNGSSSLPSFIYTGFKPKFVIVKNISQTDNWFMHDDKRDGFNDDNEYLFSDINNVEGTNTNRIRLLSNGFSVPTTDKSHNVDGNNYVYMAFGQSIVGSNNIPATAR